MIEVPEKSLVELVKAAYNMSYVVGLGFLHATDQPFTDKHAMMFIDYESKNTVSMDYVAGRCVKFNVYKEKGKYYINDSWYDHSAEDQLELELIAEKYKDL